MNPDQAMAYIRSHTTETPDGCLQFEGKRQKGYGSIVVDGRDWRVHRFVWTQLRGELPEDLVPDHTCHQAPCPGGISCLHRRCWNPDHIVWVTNAENTAAERRSTSWRTRKKPPRIGRVRGAKYMI